MKKTISSLAGAGAILSVATSRVLAQATNTSIGLIPTGQFGNLGKITPQSLISFAINIMFLMAGVIFFFMLVWGGIEWITSAGDKAANENARKRITNSLIGLAIVFAAWAILGLISTITGINFQNLGSIPTLIN